MAEMTPQKALEILEMFLHKQCNLQRTEFAYSDIEVYCAVSMAKNALEKPLQETTEQDKALTIAFGKDGKARVLNEDYVIYCADKETFEKVKEAVEKQISKKVIPFKRTAHYFQSDICKHSGYPCEHIKTFNNEYQYTDYKCPLCHKRVSDGTPKHCDKCGQALDWSDTE